MQRRGSSVERNPKAYIRLRGKAFDISCYLGRGRPRMTGGGAEYEAQRRADADAATVFMGNGLLSIDVPVLFDGWGPPGKRRDVGPRIEQVQNLAFGQDQNPPPSFIATGPMPGSGGRFQMALPEELDDPEPIVGEGGTVFRQGMMLKLIGFNDPSAIAYKLAPDRGLGKSRNGGTTAPPNSIELTRPETLLQVAAAVYGDPSMAAAIGDINDIKDVRKKLKTGTRLKLPAGGPAFGVAPYGQEV